MIRTSLGKTLPCSLLLAGLSFLGLASPASAGLDLSWRACGTARGDSAAVLDCANLDSVTVLYGTFQVPDTLERVAAITIYLDVILEAKHVPDFWDLTDEGCNKAGVVFTKDWPEDACPGTESPWSGMGISGINSWGDQNDDNRTRIRLAGGIAVSDRAPITLLPGINYHAFQIRIFSDRSREAGDSCDGCRTPVAIGWTSAKIEQVPVKRERGKAWPSVLLTGRGLGTNRVALNGPRAETMRELGTIDPKEPEPTPDPSK